MTNLVIFSGIDISKSSFDVSYELNGRYRSKKFSYTPEGMVACTKFLPINTHCVMEATGTYHCRLAHYLHDYGIYLSIVNPLSVKRYSQALMLRSKTDKADSKLLVEYAKKMLPPRWQPKKDHFVELQQLMKYRDLLVKERTQTSNHLEAINHSKVRSLIVLKGLKERLIALDNDIKAIEEEMKLHAENHEAEALKLLTSIPGIGIRTAIALISYTCSMENFDSAKQISSYFGLSPRIYESGTTVKGKSKICKVGNSDIRKLLFMCSLTASKCNKACQELYDRLVLRGKSKKLALIAVANKLIKQAFAIVKNKMMYNEKIISEKLAN